MAQQRSRLEKLLRVAAAALVPLALGLAAHSAFYSASGRLIVPEGPPQWIMLNTPVAGALQQWGHLDAPVGHFSAEFLIENQPNSARLSAQSLGALTLSLNDEVVPIVVGAEREPRSWREPIEFDVAHLLRTGENRIDVEVRDFHGPPLLALVLDGSGIRFETGSHWVGALDDGEWAPVLAADDRRPYPDANLGEEPIRALAERWRTCLALAIAGVAGFLAQRRFLNASPRWLWLISLCVVGSLWLFLFFNKFGHISLRTGFDAPRHLFYLDYLLRVGRVPLATESFATYHPPLFYLLAAATSKIATALGVASTTALKLVPFLAGLGSIGLAAHLARRLAPGRPGVATYATLFAGLLPMNLYISAYFSNEGLHAALSAAALVLAAGLLLDGNLSTKKVAFFSTLGGLALLTKVTALVVVGPAALTVAMRVWIDRSGQRSHLVTQAAALLLPMLLISGWFYVRNIIHFGQPVVANWDLDEPGLIWWSQPGFHTPSYYLSFGEVLLRPYLSGYLSFWDSLYSTLWGDGFLGGMGPLRARHPDWRYEYMAAGYVLAIPATILLLLGTLKSMRRAISDPSAGQRAAHALLVLTCAGMGFAVFYLTLTLAYVGQAKAFYGLSCLPALALFLAMGAQAVDDWLARRSPIAGRAVWFGWLSLFLGVVFLSFAAPGLPEVAAVYADAHREVGDYSRDEGNLDEAIRHYHLAIGANPDLPDAHRGLATALRSTGDSIGAIRHYRRALELDPHQPQTSLALADTLLLVGRGAESIRHYERGLESTGSAEAHNNFGIALRSQGQTERAIEEFLYALELRPDYEKARRNLDQTRRLEAAD